MVEKLQNKFAEVFGTEGEAHVYFAPGRVNMIGEHTDYNGGHVFPCALTIGTYGVVRKREDNKLRFYSMNFEQLGVLESSLEDLVPSKEADWTNYPKGVIWAFKERGMEVTEGFDLLLFGNIPNGSGLSSSASVEVLTGYILKDLYGFDVTNQDLALIGQYSENHFNGVNCGIMDQFAIAMGKEDHAIFLDTNTLDYTYVPLKLEGAKIVIACSNKKRGLGDSKYNERRSECETALAELQTLVEEAWKVEGVIGSRMTGAGFGGCTVSIVEDAAVDRFIESVGAAYKDKIGYAADFYVVQVGSGPCRLDA